MLTSRSRATGCGGVTSSGFQIGESVAVFGGSAVGQMAAYCAILRDASRVYAIDRYQKRLHLAKSISVIATNFTTTDSVQQRMAL